MNQASPSLESAVFFSIPAILSLSLLLKSLPKSPPFQSSTSIFIYLDKKGATWGEKSFINSEKLADWALRRSWSVLRRFEFRSVALRLYNMSSQCPRVLRHPSPALRRWFAPGLALALALQHFYPFSTFFFSFPFTSLSRLKASVSIFPKKITKQEIKTHKRVQN